MTKLSDTQRVILSAASQHPDRLALAIETRREPHEGGWHGRFVLHTPLVIVARSDWPEKTAAA